MKTINYTVMREEEIDSMVKRELNVNCYAYLKAEEGATISIYDNVTPNLDVYDIGDFEQWRKGIVVKYSTGALLRKLCSKNCIPPGNYLIDARDP